MNGPFIFIICLCAAIAAIMAYKHYEKKAGEKPSAGAGTGTAAPDHSDNKTDEQKRP